MSSILIKDMEMPKSCADCFFRQAATNSLDVYFCYADKNNRYAGHDKRPSFCPLTEIPTPHGRLIDADRLLAIIKSAAGDQLSVPLAAVLDSIEHAPVIVGKEK